MKRLNELERERDQTQIILGLTSAFEGIASMRISQVKDQTQMSERFFTDLWWIYSQIWLGETFQSSHNKTTNKIKKELLMLITSEGSLSGDIDERLVGAVLKKYQPEQNDIIVIGQHGAQLLNQQRIRYKRNFRLPTKDMNINVAPLVAEVQDYASTTVYYTNYVSIMDQEIKTMQLAKALMARGKQAGRGMEVINEQNYIFEPSSLEVVSYLEGTMLQIMISELILESKLAQYASRFKAMSLARQKAVKSLEGIKWTYNVSKRRLKDEQLKRTVSNLGRQSI